jgi:adenylate cyclase
MTDELINALGKVRGLKVVGRSSVFRFKGQQYDSAEVGELLQVGALLEGTVRKAGERLRITTQLINAADGFELWSDRYESEMKDVFDVQDEISRAMVGALSSELLGDVARPIVKRSTDDPEAYRLYLQGLRWESSSDAARRRIELLEEALNLDPDFAEAHAVLAEALAFLSILGLEQPSDVMERARRASSRALSLDETLGEGHTALALVLYYYDWDHDGAERSYRRALALGPTAYSHGMYGLLLANMGRFDEGIGQMEKALKIDPLSIRGNLGLSYILGFAGRFLLSLQQAQRCLDID